MAWTCVGQLRRTGPVTAWPSDHVQRVDQGRSAGACGAFMSKRNWVCFDCRTVVRAEPYARSVVPCATCAKPRVNLGYKIPVPPKAHVQEWERLRAEYYSASRDHERRRAEQNVRRRHQLEKEIARLTAMDHNQGRVEAIKTLKKKLDDLDA